MKRAHRSAHRLIWLLLTPVIAASLWLAITHRPAPPVTTDLPPVLTSDTGGH
ncbi:MAG: hypothetical protein AAF253_06900 [Pseudomonadota bacterium]